MRLTIIGLAAILLMAAAPSGTTPPDNGSAPPATTAPPAETLTGEEQEFLKTAASLDYKTGTIDLGQNLADVKVGEGFRFLDQPNAEIFLTKLWGNPPGAADGILGLIVPIDPSPFGPHGWAAVVSYDDSGHVSDADAFQINYSDLLKQMQKGAEDQNASREQQGYQPIKIVGWAKPPFYDHVQKKLFWAEDIRFGNDADTLNYRIRALGRQGVLEINIVGPLADLADIDSKAKNILAMVDFKSGQTYGEFDPKIDKKAAFGIAGLIAGGLLVKAGFLKLLLAGLLAAKKFILLGVVAAGATIRGFFSRLFPRKQKPVPVSPEMSAPALTASPASEEPAAPAAVVSPPSVT